MERHTVGASDDNLETSAPLAFVSCLFCYHWGAPECAFVVGQASWIGAVKGVGGHGRITLDVHVERQAAGGLVAQRCTSKRVEGFQGIETHVVRCAERSVLVLKGGRIAIGRGSNLSECLRININKTTPCLRYRMLTWSSADAVKAAGVSGVGTGPEPAG